MSSRLPEGTKLKNQYIIRRVLGEGGFGITYEAQNELVDRRVAIKELFIRDMMERNELSPQVKLISDEDSEQFAACRRAFLNEARAVGRYSKNRSVVDVTDYFEENGTAYIVMEYLEGDPLGGYLDKWGNFGIREAFTRFLPIMQALEALHRDKVIHRDISPDNLCVLSDDTIVLMDFGAARSFGKSSRMSRIVKDGFTPVEQYTETGSQGPWTDIYSLCATIYFSITGVVPYSSVSRMLYDELLPPSKISADIIKDEKDAALEKILMKGLSVNPEDRYHDLSGMISEIRAAIPETEKSGETVKSNDSKAKASRKKLIASIVCAAAATAVVIVCLFAFVFKGNGNTVMEYDPQTMYRVTLTAPDEMSARGFNEAAELIEQKLAIISPDEPWSMKVDGYTVEIIVMQDVLCGEQPLDFFRAFITRATNYYLADNSEITYTSNIELPREAIESVTKREEEADDGSTYWYLEAVLADDYAAENAQTLKEWKENLILAEDLDMNSSVYYYADVELAHGERTLNIRLADRCRGIEEFADLQLFNMTHEPYECAFNINVETETAWEEPGEGTDGLQCTRDALTGDLVEFDYTVSEDFSEGDLLDINNALRKRLDTLGAPYAVGTVESTGLDQEEKYRIAAGLSNINEQIAQLLCDSTHSYYFITESGRMNACEGSLYGWDVRITENTDGTYCLCFEVSADDNIEKLKNLTENATEGSPLTVYLTASDYSGDGIPLLYTEITEPAADGVISFDRIYDAEKSAVTDETLWYLNFIKEVWDGDEMPTGLSYSSLQFYPQQADETLSAEDFGIVTAGIKDEEDIQEAVSGILPDAGVSIHNRYIYVSLGLDVGETFVDDSISYIKQIYDATAFEKGYFSSMLFYLTDENNSEGERCRITYNKSYDSETGKVVIENDVIMMGERFETYQSAFEDKLL